MNNCPFCSPNKEEVIIEHKTCLYITNPSKVLLGSGMIIPKLHRETVFDLSAEEMKDTFEVLQMAKTLIDKKLKPDGYNVGWNCYSVGGQTVPHAHLHVIPRFCDEPLAGKGIRHHLNDVSNRRSI